MLKKYLQRVVDVVSQNKFILAFYDLSTNSTYQNPDGSAKEKGRETAEFQIAKNNWLTAEKKYKDQQAAIAQAQAQVTSTWLLYQDTQNALVKAPSNGVIANLAISSGNTIEAKNLTDLTTILPALTIASPKNKPIKSGRFFLNALRAKVKQKELLKPPSDRT